MSSENPKKLIIAEKPSVAADIARSLGGFTKHDDYFESDEYVLSSAVGHLVEIKAPDEFEVKRGKWSFANLPVLPTHFDLNPIAKTESRLKVLNRLIKRKDVVGLINACDATIAASVAITIAGKRNHSGMISKNSNRIKKPHWIKRRMSKRTIVRGMIQKLHKEILHCPQHHHRFCLRFLGFE